VSNEKTNGTVPATKKDIREWLNDEELKKQFAMALPSILTVDRFIRVANTIITRTPKLGECTPESLIACLLDCAALGIEPDGRRAHLIPFKDKCTLIIDYKGYIELARRSGEISIWRPELVCENDIFEYSKGLVTTHVIDFRKPRGEVFAAYSYVRFKDGAEDYEVMSIEEIEATRKRSKAANCGPWVTDRKQMIKKTPMRRHANRLPLSAEFRDALEKDADSFDPDYDPRLEFAPRRLSDLPPPVDVPAEVSDAKTATDEGGKPRAELNLRS